MIPSVSPAVDPTDWRAGRGLAALARPRILVGASPITLQIRMSGSEGEEPGTHPSLPTPMWTCGVPPRRVYTSQGVA